MLALRAAAIARLYHSSLDRILGIDRRTCLNDGTEAGPVAGAQIAAALSISIKEMAAEAYDTRRRCFDYRALRASGSYRRYRERAASLTAFDPATLTSRAEKLAFWINLYNALIADAVIAFAIKKSVREDSGFFRRAAYRVGGMRYSADDIEHGVLRGNRRHFHPAIPFRQFAADDPRCSFVITELDPRIHCALVCASRSCPPIAAYEAPSIDSQLELAARNFVNAGGVTAQQGTLRFSRIFHWYGKDFGGPGGVREFALSYLEEGPVRQRLKGGGKAPRLAFQPYDWSLNGP